MCVRIETTPIKEKAMKPSAVVTALLSAVTLAASTAAFADSPTATFKDGVLVDSRGMTLYTFDKDSAGGGRSVCNAQCAAVWPPLAASAGGAGGGEFAVITRDDGSKQLAHKGRPLYLYAPDQKPGDMTGDNTGGVWHVVRSAQPAAAPKPAGGSPYSTPGY